jgi:hypothetical protein
MIGSVIAVSFAFLAIFFCDRIKRLLRKGKELELYLGVALARINNTDIELDSHKAPMGVGLDEHNINDWVKDIWESFDRDGNG